MLYVSKADKSELDSFCKSVKESFWRLHEESNNYAFEEFEHPNNVELVSLQAEELFDSCLIVRDCGWNGELEKAKSSFKELPHRQMSFVIAKASRIDGTGGLVAWNQLIPVDWYKILPSFCLVSYDKYFCQTFSNEKMFLIFSQVNMLIA